MNDTNPDPYAVLGVTRTATQQQINRAYRRLLRRHHPDTRSRNAVLAGDLRLVMSYYLMAAYAVLRDPVTRAEHDRSRPPAPAFRPRPEPRRGPGPDGSRMLIRPSGSASATRSCGRPRSGWAPSYGGPPVSRTATLPARPLFPASRHPACSMFFPAARPPGRGERALELRCRGHAPGA